MAKKNTGGGGGGGGGKSDKDKPAETKPEPKYEKFEVTGDELRKLQEENAINPRTPKIIMCIFLFIIAIIALQYWRTHRSPYTPYTTDDGFRHIWLTHKITKIDVPKGAKIEFEPESPDVAWAIGPNDDQLVDWEPINSPNYSDPHYGPKLTSIRVATPPWETNLCEFRYKIVPN